MFSGDNRDGDAKRAFQSLLFLSLTVPSGPKWAAFVNEVTFRAKRDYNFTYDEEVNSCFQIMVVCGVENLHFGEVDTEIKTREVDEWETFKATNPSKYKQRGISFLHLHLFPCNQGFLLCTFELQVNYFVGAFYDSVIYLGRALNKTIDQNQNPRNGTIVAQKLWNHTFPGW